MEALECKALKEGTQLVDTKRGAVLIFVRIIEALEYVLVRDAASRHYHYSMRNCTGHDLKIRDLTLRTPK